MAKYRIVMETESEQQGQEWVKALKVSKQHGGQIVAAGPAEEIIIKNRMDVTTLHSPVSAGD